MHLDFASSSLSWLVVTPDHKVTLSGKCWVNGKPGYGFVLYGYAPDRYRLVVWGLAEGDYPATTKVYDNRPSTEYDLDRADPQRIDLGLITMY